MRMKLYDEHTKQQRPLSTRDNPEVFINYKKMAPYQWVKSPSKTFQPKLMNTSPMGNRPSNGPWNGTRMQRIRRAASTMTPMTKSLR